MKYEPEKVLQQYWGYPSFRELQLPIIESVLRNNDTLALLPTGGGKSICYQVPALCIKKLGIVISPLIALMQDQISQLQDRGIRAVALHSGMTRTEIKRHLENATRGAYDFLYLSPERLKTDLFLGHLPYMDIALVAVDEAHCISQWGHDFRPSYREIAEIRPLIPEVPFIAVTATATKLVAKDIIEQLELKQAEQFKSSFARTNLKWVVINDAYDLERLSHIVRQVKGSMIIYANARFRTAEIANFLQKRGFKALHYHAGLDAKIREQRQEEWMKGDCRIMVSTNAFGMGVDKADVRAVIHMDIPLGPEEYYQEAGRAGRDGETSFAVMIQDESKIKETGERLEKQYPGIDYCRDVYHALGKYFKIAYGSGEMATFPFDISDFANKFEFNSFEAYHALSHIEKSGWIQLNNMLDSASRIFIRTSKDQLYEMQVRNKQLDLFMKTILRMYEGVFLDFVKINEREIGRRLDIPAEKVFAYLQRLKELEVLEYAPSVQGTAITFLRERVQKERFFIDKEIYTKSYERTTKRWEAMMSYVHSSECRTRQLLHYFGEEKSENCGQCDICLGSQEAEFKADEKKQVRRKLLDMMREKPLRPRDIAYRFSYNLEKKVLNLLKELEKEELIYMDNDHKLKVPE